MGIPRNPGQFRKPKAKDAFTLIELMCAVVIMAVLAVSALPYVEDYITWGQQVWNHYELTILNEGLLAYQTSGRVELSEVCAPFVNNPV
jgi:prepilin-type N-terminal cleavage/methylation domain-containing protein